MGRRRIPHPLAVGVVGVLLGAGLSLIAFLNNVGFDLGLDFLKSRPLVESTVGGHESASRASYGELRLYFWDEPAASVFPRADRELRGKGFRLVRRKGEWAQWERGPWTVALDAYRIGGRLIALQSKHDSRSTMVYVEHEIPDDTMFSFRLLFSPYGITQS